MNKTEFFESMTKFPNKGANVDVISYITNIFYGAGEEHAETIEDFFISRMPYAFAWLLKKNFKRGTVAEYDSQICWWDVDGYVYNASGCAKPEKESVKVIDSTEMQESELSHLSYNRLFMQRWFETQYSALVYANKDSEDVISALAGLRMGYGVCDDCTFVELFTNNSLLLCELLTYILGKGEIVDTEFGAVYKDVEGHKYTIEGLTD